MFGAYSYVPNGYSHSSRPLPPTVHERLTSLCAVRYESDGRTVIKHSDEDFALIADLLRDIGKDDWARIPRTYMVLRMMGAIPVMDAFTTLGLDDNSFPYPNKLSLPVELQSLELSQQFLEYQKYVLTEACDLEKGEHGAHIQIEDGDVLFNRHKSLGIGSTG